MISSRLKIVGSQQNGRAYLYEALDYVAKGKVKIIVETYTLGEVNKVYDPSRTTGQSRSSLSANAWRRTPRSARWRSRPRRDRSGLRCVGRKHGCSRDSCGFPRADCLQRPL